MGSPVTRFCLILLFLFYNLSSTLSQQESSGVFETPFQCGNITAGYPFTGLNRNGYCGNPSLKLNCNKRFNTTSLMISGHNYSVLYIDNKTNIIRLSRQDFSEPFCSVSFSSTYLPSDLFQNLPSYKSLTVFYACDPRRHFLGNFTCPVKGLGSVSVIQKSTYGKLCDESFTVTVPASYVPEEEALNLTHLESVLRNGFEVKLKMINEEFCQGCLSSGGYCGFFILNRHSCCRNITRSGVASCHVMSSGGPNIKNSSVLLIIGAVPGSILAVYAVIIAFLFWKRRKTNAQRDQNLDALVTLKRYSYGQIKKITKSFTEVIRRGGFGTVYIGKLRDGSKVSVKV